MVKKKGLDRMKKSLSGKIFDAFNAVFMFAMIVITLYPLLYVVFASFSDSNRLISYTGLLYAPVGFSVGAYKEVFANRMMLISFRNTLMYVFFGTLLNMVLTVMGAFALSRKRLWIKKYVNIGIVITMFFSGGLIPSYLLVRNIGLYNTPFAIILPVAINSWNLIVMRTTFQGFPDELEEAAKIDGANDFYTLWNIVVPLCSSTIAVIALFYAVNNWNSWFSAAIYLDKRELFPLQLYLREVLIFSNTESMIGENATGADVEAISESIKYATIVVSTLPILVVYPFLQKYFVKGVMVGAIKG